jgi:hypothetical protein
LNQDPDGALIIWEIESGRAIKSYTKDLGGVGFGNDIDYCCTQWNKFNHIGLSHDTNGISVFDPFSMALGDNSVKRIHYFGELGWSRPPKWAWSECIVHIFFKRDIYIKYDCLI